MGFESAEERESAWNATAPRAREDWVAAIATGIVDWMGQHGVVVSGSYYDVRRVPFRLGRRTATAARTGHRQRLAEWVRRSCRFRRQQHRQRYAACAPAAQCFHGGPGFWGSAARGGISPWNMRV